MTPRKISIAAVVGLVAVALAVRHYAGDPGRAKKSPPPAIAVTALQINAGDVPIYLTGLGTIQAYNTVTVRARVDGELTAVKFREGQDVKKGDVLAQIDSRSYEAALHNALAILAKDEAALANAKQDLKRYEETALSGYSSRQRVDTQSSAVATLSASVQADQAVIENARVQLSFTSIAAPIDGRTGIRLIDQGNIVRANDPNGLVVITQVQPISAVFTLPQDELPRVVDADANGPLKVAAFSRDEATELDEGTLELIDNQIDPATGTVRLKVKFPNTQRKLWPGEFVNMRLQVGTAHDGIAVPAQVIQRGDAGPYAYVIKADDTVEMRQLDVRREQNGQILVTKGLAPGERVVLDGQLHLAPGSRVKADAKSDAKGYGL